MCRKLEGHQVASHLKLKSDKCVKTSVGKRVKFPFFAPKEQTRDNKGEHNELSVQAN